MSRIAILSFCCLFIACNNHEETPRVPLILERAFVGGQEISLTGNVTEGLPSDKGISLVFSRPINQTSASKAVTVRAENQDEVDATITVTADRYTINLQPKAVLLPSTSYTIEISDQLQGVDGEAFSGRQVSFRTTVARLTIASAEIAGESIMDKNRILDVPVNFRLKIIFSAPVNTALLEQAVSIGPSNMPQLALLFSENNQAVEITSTTSLQHFSKYEFRILPELRGEAGETFSGFSKTVYTAVDETPKLPVVTDEELLTTVQRQTFKYFWDFAHPASGMARERNTSGDIVTSGGSGFGIMTLIVGMHRNFISREEGLQRMNKILSFLEFADRFHGAWPHWMNGNTGDVVPFSANDNGGDLVETSFLVQGLLTFRQYLNANIPEEKSLIDRINVLWHGVEWDWYTRNDQSVLYWHWSPDKQWTMNLPIRGYNEALITYFLAAASPDHGIDASVYHQGWAGNGAIANNKTFYGINLPLGYDYGGPLFFAHYSFLGLDPRGLHDAYANYWTQNVNHSLINHAYSVDNPRNFVGYSDVNWGLTASDDHQGYSAHSPTNDLGVITPTAALSSFPYTPEESMKALKFFYYTLGDRLWGPYGFYDAFNITEGWTADSYLAIDQGPIIVMIENHRTGLLWDLFMSAPEVKVAMDKLGFAN